MPVCGKGAAVLAMAVVVWLLPLRQDDQGVGAAAALPMAYRAMILLKI